MLHSSKFRPAWWLRNPHAQTLWAAKIQRTPTPVTSRERLTTPDNDFVDLMWTEENDGPIVIIFHGLTGSANIAFLIDTIAKRYPDKPLAAAGFSLGGNALLKYLGTTTENALQFAVSVSPPLVLEEGAKRMDKGFSRIYQRKLISQLKITLRAKQARYPELGLNGIDIDSIETFFDFDHHVTAPLHGYKSCADYYKKASTLSDLINIKTPTHILWSADDPFFSKACIPTNDQLSDAVHFELPTHGGHVAFVSGSIPLRGHNWLCERISGLLTRELTR